VNDALTRARPAGERHDAPPRGDGGVRASLSLVEAIQIAHELLGAHRDPARRHREADAEVLERIARTRSISSD